MNLLLIQPAPPFPELGDGLSQSLLPNARHYPRISGARRSLRLESQIKMMGTGIWACPSVENAAIGNVRAVLRASGAGE